MLLKLEISTWCSMVEAIRVLIHEDHIIVEATDIDTILVMFNINVSISIVATGSK